MFVTVGVFLYGFNLKETAKESRKTADDMKQVYFDALKTNDEIRKSKEAVADG